MIKNARIVQGVSVEEYHHQTADRGTEGFVLSSHALSEILRNAQRWVKGYVSPESKAKKYGELLDCLLLTPKQWPRRFTVLPADAPRKPTKAQINAKKPSPETVAAIKWWKAFDQNHPGEIVSNEANAAVHAAIARLREDRLIADLLDASQKQIWIAAEWHDPVYKLTVPIKGLIDIVPPSDDSVFGNSLWDLKTTANASPRQFAKDAQRFNYHIQAALYLDLWNTASGERRSDFGHIVQENYAPYEFRTPPPLLSQRFLQHGRIMYQKAISIYCNAVTTGHWPGYDAHGQDWPLTDCDDWFLAAETVYEPLEEEPEPEEEPAEVDLIP